MRLAAWRWQQSSMWGIVSAAALAAAGCGGDPPIAVDVELNIAGPDTLRFGAAGHVVALSAAVTSASQPAPPVRWVSTDPRVADVDARGSVYILRSGEAIVIARAEAARDSVWIEVDQIPVALSFHQQPGDAAIGFPLTPSVVVTATDSNDFQVNSPTTSVDLAFSTNPVGATLGGVLSQPLLGGAATYTNLVVDGAGVGFILSAVSSSAEATSEPFDVLPEPDLIRIANTTGVEQGLLIDGHNAGLVDDLTMIDVDTAFSVVLSASPVSNEILAFTAGRPPAVLFPAPWSRNVDTVDVVFRDPIQIDVTAWIVIGPFATVRDRVIAQAVTTEAIWAAERVGIEFAEFAILDATGDPDANRLQAVTACEMRSLAESVIGREGGRINIYYVGTVDGGRDRGYSCAGGDAIFMADRSGFELLVHEIGHSFGLGHVDALQDYDRTNVMHSASSVREFFTEGQAFRSHYDTFTALNQVYGAIPVELARPCFDSDSHERCPPLRTRLWADGPFPPNHR